YSQLTLEEKEAVERIETLVDLADFEEEVTQKKKLNEDVDTQIEILPNSDSFYNQQQFIAQLTALITSEKHSIIFVYGGGGIGKTATVSETLRQLPQQNQNIVWCNLGDRLSFTENVEFIYDQWNLDENANDAITVLGSYLENNPQILIFDHWELLFEGDRLSGSYQPQYQKYDELLKQLAAISIQGTVLVLTREIAPSMDRLVAASPTTVTSLTVPPLTAQTAQKILQEYKLQDEELWPDLIEIYQGNPLNLRLICNSIKEWYGGSVAAFQRQNTIIGGDTLREILKELIQPITRLEQQVLYWLMLWGQPITLAELQEKKWDKVLFSTQIWDAVRSLERRFLIRNSDSPTLRLLALQPSIKRYLVQQFIQDCCEEITEAIADNYSVSDFDLLKNYQLLLSDQPNTQSAIFVITSILRGLKQVYLEPERVQTHLTQLKQAIKQQAIADQKYALANINQLLKYNVG
ncbi:MAG: hypothetical protein WBB82_15890, partial [Limnothrix sp.]